MKKNMYLRYVDLSLTAFLVVFYTFCSLIHLGKVIFFNYSESGGFKLPDNMALYLIDWVMVLVYIHIVAIIIKALLVKNVSWKKIIGLHLILFVFLGIILQSATDLWYIQAVGSGNYVGGLKMLIHYMVLDFLTYFSMVFIIHLYHYLKESREKEVQKNLLKTQLVTAEMNALTSQIQPHFLFNTINCIVSLIEINPVKAQNTLVDLSSFFREITNSSKSHYITLRKEFKILGYYLNILKVRFQENLIIEENISGETTDELIPAIILQPLIENSVKYGYSYSQDQLVIKISTFIQDGFLILVVENNGTLLKEEFSSLQKGVGISNTLERLKNVYNREDVFTLQNKEDGSGVENIIRIPC